MQTLADGLLIFVPGIFYFYCDSQILIGLFLKKDGHSWVSFLSRYWTRKVDLPGPTYWEILDVHVIINLRIEEVIEKLLRLVTIGTFTYLYTLLVEKVVSRIFLYFIGSTKKGF